MSLQALDPKEFFVGRMTGEGQVTGWTGRVLRSFSLEYFGEWSIGHDALHLDETVNYRDGRLMRRHWAIQFDGHGDLLGYDSNQAARLRGRTSKDGLRLVFDRPLGLTPEIAAPRVVVDLIVNDVSGLRLEGRAGVLGLAIQRMQADLYRA